MENNAENNVGNPGKDNPEKVDEQNNNSQDEDTNENQSKDDKKKYQVSDMGKAQDTSLPVKADSIKGFEVEFGRPQKDHLKTWSDIEKNWNRPKPEGTHNQGLLQGHGVTSHDPEPTGAALDDTEETKIRRFEPPPKTKTAEGTCTAKDGAPAPPPKGSPGTLSAFEPPAKGSRSRGGPPKCPERK